MVRGKRTNLVASSLIAIPFALLLSSFLGSSYSTADSPYHEPARVLNAGKIQQTIGKQPGRQRSRNSGNLFDKLRGGQKSSTQAHTHSKHVPGKSPGLLDGLLGVTGKEPAKRNATPVQSASNSDRKANWDGIPYHSPHGTARAESRTPVRDPGYRSSGSSRSTSVARGSGATSSRSQSKIVTREPISTRNASTSARATPSVTRKPVASVAKIPAPPKPTTSKPVETLAKTPEPKKSQLSVQTSSRRSGRKSIVTLGTSELVAAVPKVDTTKKSVVPKTTTDLGMIPKVARKAIEVPKTASKPAVVQKPETKVAAAKPQPAVKVPANPVSKPAATSVAAAPAPAPIAVKPPVPAPAPAQVSPQVATPPTSVPTNQVAQNSVQATQTPRSVAWDTKPISQQQPSASVSSRRTASTSLAAPQPRYQTPQYQQPTGAPASAHPSVATAPQSPQFGNATPSQPASHRAGPPSDVFGKNQYVASGAAAYNSGPAIGSGVAREPNQPSYNHAPRGMTQPYSQSQSGYQQGYAHGYGAGQARSLQPNHGSAQSTSSPLHANSVPVSPSGSNSVPGRMATFGQPVPPPAPQVAAAPRSSNRPIPASPLRAEAPSTGFANTAQAALGNGNGMTRDNFDKPQPQSIASTEVRTLDTQRELMPGQTSVASELPGIRVVTHGPSEVMIRQTHQYEIRVENRGSIDAEGLLVRAIIPDWADVNGHNASQGQIENLVEGEGKKLVWKIDDLPAGSVERMFVRLTAARSGTHDLDVDWTLMPQRAIAQVKVHEPQLDLTIDGPDEVIFGQSQTYTVRVLNPGDGTAPNVVFTLSPNSATPQTQRIGDIPSGKEAQFEVELTAQDLVDLKIHGLAVGELDLRAEADKTIRVIAAKLEAVLSGPELKYQNTESIYNLELQNVGEASSERIVARIQLPQGVEYLGGIDGAEQRDGIVAWQLGALTPGASRNYQFRCMMSQTGDQHFAFECSGTAAGKTSVAIDTQVQSIADLVLTVNDPPAPAPIGSDVIYEIIVTNRGSKAATDVKALAQFSHGIEPVRIDGQSGELVTGQVLFDPIPSIAAGQAVRLKVTAKAERGGHHRFRTEVRSGDTILVAEEATHYMMPKSERISRRSGESATR